MERSGVGRWVGVAAMSVMGVYFAAPGHAHHGFTVGVDNAPPPPRAVFVEEPGLLLIPGTSVYTVANPEFEYDMFRYKDTWYLLYDGQWYRSSDYEGSFAGVDAGLVPRQIMELPPDRWKNHSPRVPPGPRQDIPTT